MYSTAHSITTTGVSPARRSSVCPAPATSFEQQFGIPEPPRLSGTAIGMVCDCLEMLCAFNTKLMFLKHETLAVEGPAILNDARAVERLQHRAARCATLQHGFAGAPVPGCETATCFHSKFVPKLAVRKMVHSMGASTSADIGTLAAAVVLTARYCIVAEMPVTLHCIHRLFVAALWVTMKVSWDRTYHARDYAEAAGVSTRELMRQEAALLEGVGWRPLVTRSHIDEVVDHVSRGVQSGKLPQLVWFAPRLDAALTPTSAVRTTNDSSIAHRASAGSRLLPPSSSSPVKQTTTTPTAATALPNGQVDLRNKTNLGSSNNGTNSRLRWEVAKPSASTTVGDVLSPGSAPRTHQQLQQQQLADSSSLLSVSNVDRFNDSFSPATSAHSPTATTAGRKARVEHLISPPAEFASPAPRRGGRGAAEQQETDSEMASPVTAAPPGPLPHSSATGGNSHESDPHSSIVEIVRVDSTVVPRPSGGAKNQHRAPGRFHALGSSDLHLQSSSDVGHPPHSHHSGCPAPTAAAGQGQAAGSSTDRRRSIRRVLSFSVTSGGDSSDHAAGALGNTHSTMQLVLSTPSSGRGSSFVGQYRNQTSPRHLESPDGHCDDGRPARCAAATGEIITDAAPPAALVDVAQPGSSSPQAALAGGGWRAARAARRASSEPLTTDLE